MGFTSTMPFFGLLVLFRNSLLDHLSVNKCSTRTSCSRTAIQRQIFARSSSYITSWWFQPIWKIWVKLETFPTVRGLKISKMLQKTTTLSDLDISTLGLLFGVFFYPYRWPFWRPKASSTKATAWCCPATAGVRSHGNSLRWMVVFSWFFLHIYDEKYIFK